MGSKKSTGSNAYCILPNAKSTLILLYFSHMFWTSWGSKSVIERAAMDGTHRKVVVSNVGRAKSLTIDYAELRIYWVDIDNNVIEGADLVGKFEDHVLVKNYVVI